MANTLLTISQITREALLVLENNLVLGGLVNREYDSQFAVSGAKIGATANVRKPPRYTTGEGAAITPQDTVETSVAVQLAYQTHVPLVFTSQELTLSIDDFRSRILDPAIAALANKIDWRIAELYKEVYNSVGTPGTVPATAMVYLLAGVKLDEGAAPRDEHRSCVINSMMEATIVDALKGLFQQATAIAQQYAKGRMGIALGFTFAMDQNINTHTVGPLGGTPLVNGASQTGANLITDGWTAAAANRLKKGDVFTLPLVYRVNPQSRESTGTLQDFVVTADVNSDAAGAATIPIDPPITVTGQFQTVTASPADNAALTIKGTASTGYPQGLVFHRDAFVLAMADLEMPRNTDMAARVSSKQSGLSMRLVRDYAILTDQFICRVDALYGVKAIRPELAARVWS